MGSGPVWRRGGQPTSAGAEHNNMGTLGPPRLRRRAHSRRHHRQSGRRHRPHLLGHTVRSSAARSGQECKQPDRGSHERALTPRARQPCWRPTCGKFTDSRSGWLAIGGDVVADEHPTYARLWTPATKSPCSPHASDMLGSDAVRMALVELPSGQFSEDRLPSNVFPIRGRGSSVVFQVRLAAEETTHPFGVGSPNAPQYPWSGGTKQFTGTAVVSRSSGGCRRDQDWVVLDGESGSGRGEDRRMASSRTARERQMKMVRRPTNRERYRR